MTSTSFLSFPGNKVGAGVADASSPATPNPKYFDHVDWVINSAAERGMLVGLVPSWARFVNKGEPPPHPHPLSTPTGEGMSKRR